MKGSNNSPNNSNEPSPKIEFTKRYTNDFGKQKVWKGSIVKVCPKQFGLFFYKQYEYLFMVELWDKNKGPFRNLTYVCYEKEEWQIGLIYKTRFVVQKDKFSVWLKDRMIELIILNNLR